MNLYTQLFVLRGPISKLLRRLGYAGALVVMTLVILAVLAIDGDPLVLKKTASSQHYYSATRSILSKTVTPPNQAKDKLKSIALSEEDLAAVVNFALMRKSIEGFAWADIDDKRLVILMSVKLPVRLADLYLNLKLIADDADPNAFIKQVKVGSIALPKPLVNLVAWWLAHTTQFGHYARMTAPLLREVRIGEGRLRVVINWDREIMGQAQDLVADLADRERMRFYYLKLADVVEKSQLRRFIGLGALTQPLFALARERSATQDGLALEENRALILVLGAYANGKDIGPAIFSDEAPPSLGRREVLLNRRVDAAQHFTASAVLVISGQRAFTDMVGLAKEFNDTHGGSGFSFIDLAADRAGALFGKMAVSSEESARRVQDILSQTADESIFMPRTGDLPENLGAEDFARQFGDIDNAQFNDMKKEIEDRILACRLYQQGEAGGLKAPASKQPINSEGIN